MKRPTNTTSAVRFSRHDLRLIPRGDVFTRVLRWKFETNEGATVRFGRDVFDNCVVACNYAEPAKELRFQLELDLELERKNPFDFILAPEAASLPFAYRPELRGCWRRFSKCWQASLLEIPRWERPRMMRRDRPFPLLW